MTDRIPEGLSYALRLLPEDMAREIMGLAPHELMRAEELRLRAPGVSTLYLGGKMYRLKARLTAGSLEGLLELVTRGSMYAYRDTVSEGYISAPYGVRIGIVGTARYEGGRIVGVSGIRGLVVRIPGAPSSLGAQLYSAFLGTRRGMLIHSPVRGGKTTAIRSLAGKIADGTRSVVVIDERGEFYPPDYMDSGIDILSGYKKADGLRIAVASLSPDVVIVDEISGAEMLPYLNSGLILVATAHAGSYAELRSRVALAPLFESGIFDTFAEISHTGTGDKINVRSAEVI